MLSQLAMPQLARNARRMVLICNQWGRDFGHMVALYRTGLQTPPNLGIFWAMEKKQHVVVKPDVCGGRPIVAGTRMRVADILAMLAGGTSESEILTDFPYISSEDIRACLAYAAEAVDHRIVKAAA
jgi:uncharacterized protein (DUF433 family)